jgi:hypothetical protein
MKIFLYTLLLTLSFSISPAFAAEWVKLGARNVNFKAEQDVIQVGASEGTFTAIKLDVDRGGIMMYDIVVTFGNGENFSPKTRINFSKGSLSRSIDLPGKARIIKKVRFVYKSKGKRKNRLRKAKIILFGKQALKLAFIKKVKKANAICPNFPGWKYVGS